MNTEAPAWAAGTDTRFIAAALTEHYGISTRKLTRFPVGQGTLTYRASAAEGDVFVKWYPPEADLEAEMQAIRLADFAAANGVPVPRIQTTDAGQLIDRRSRISVWEWVRGETVTEQLTDEQYRQVGATLGRVHAAFAVLPGSGKPAAQVARWWNRMDVTALTARVDRLRAVASKRAESKDADDLDHLAVQSLDERRQDLARIPELIATVPRLSTQVVHGDYSLMNLLFEGDLLNAVVDFRPPQPFLIAYELGRVAFSPDTMVTDQDWLAGSQQIIESYLQANPWVRADDVRGSVRVALLHLLHSLYGIKQHYTKPAVLQPELDRFWQHRHRTTHLLLSHLAQVDSMLAEVISRQHL